MIKHTLTISILFLFLFIGTLKSESFTISGYVKNSESGETLIGATVSIPEIKKGTRTNVYGFYSLTIPEGKYKLRASYVGYSPFTKDIDINKDLKFDIELTSKSIQTQEVVVTAKSKDYNVASIEMSSIAVSTDIIKKMPALLGEVDVIKSIQLLPGVSTVGEGSTGFNVRGGSVSQNLVILDEAPVFNSSHLFGFFSVFNPDAVKDVKLIKGGIPANYGGRLSSILDVRLKEGNNKAFQADGGIGAIFSRLSVEGPIVKNEGSFLLAGRRSYVDILSKPFLDDDLSDAQFYFYDLTAKANYKLDDDNTIFLSGYFGRDVFGAGFEFNWGSETLTARWNHLFSNKLFANLTYYYSNYDTKVRFGEEDTKFEFGTHIINNSLKYDLEYFIDTDNTISFGFEGIHYDFVPGDAEAISFGTEATIEIDDKYAFENGLYIDYEMNMKDALKAKIGLRGSTFYYLGPGQYLENNLPDAQVKKAKSGEIISKYFNLEPRVSLQYQLNKESSLKASYNRTTQYIHLLSNTASPTPLDQFTPSSNNLKPQLSDQYALGYFKNFDDNEWETSVEIYYKDMQNQIDFIDGANLQLNVEFEKDVLSGIGRAYGAEFYIKKNKGLFTGWLSYTLSKTERKIDGISQNEWYLTRFDKMHNLSLVLFYDLDEYWQLSSNFVYSSGAPVTYPTDRIQFQGVEVNYNSTKKRNEFKLSDYHRLDLSISYTSEHDPESWINGQWVFSIYNLYNRKNAFSIYPEFVDNKPQMTRFSVLGTIVPSISYNFKIR